MSGRATLKDWFLLARPWSVTAPLVPFLVGAGMARAADVVEPQGWLRWALALVSAVLLVLACNLFNTWGDERSGVDRVEGAFLTTPQIQQGKITLRQTFIYGAIVFLLAAAFGLPTLAYPSGDGWGFNGPLFVAALIGFAGAVNYSTGVKYKYLGLGVPCVALLEGWLYVFVVLSLLAPQAVAAKCAALAAAPAAACRDFVRLAFLAMPVAVLVGVILHGNDMRDMATDRRAGIRSLAMALGPRGALVLFVSLHLLAYLPPLVMALSSACDGNVLAAARHLLPFLVLPLALRLMATAGRDWKSQPEAPAWIDLEKTSGGLHFLFGLLYSLSF